MTISLICGFKENFSDSTFVMGLGTNEESSLAICWVINPLS